jgi:hypothetical protein
LNIKKGSRRKHSHHHAQKGARQYWIALRKSKLKATTVRMFSELPAKRPPRRRLRHPYLSRAALAAVLPRYLLQGAPLSNIFYILPHFSRVVNRIKRKTAKIVSLSFIFSKPIAFLF